jgi:CTP:molybdopterin cytidylyltransferase MocA
VTEAGAAVPAGVLLAAGAGTRLGVPKARVRLAGEPLAARGARTLRAGGCAPVVVVLGAEAERVRTAVEHAGAEVVLNERWAEGMATSLAAGLRALAGRAPAAVVALADQPDVTAGVIQRLLAAWRTGAAAVVATYDGAPRNPVLFDAAVWDDVVASVRGDEGARAWLRAHPEQVLHVECGALGSAADVDTPDDLVALHERRGSAQGLGSGSPGTAARRTEEEPCS